MVAWVDDINTGARVLTDIIHMTPEGAQQSVYKTSCVITFYVTALQRPTWRKIWMHLDQQYLLSCFLDDPRPSIVVRIHI